MLQESSSGPNDTATHDSSKGVVSLVMEEDHGKFQELATTLAQLPSTQESSNDVDTMTDTMTDATTDTMTNTTTDSQPDPLNHPWFNQEGASAAAVPIRRSARQNNGKLKPAEILVDEDAVEVEHVQLKPQLAIAIPILVLGRPKLIDITNLAPMHKRKRSLAKSIPMPAVKKVATRASLRNGDNRRSVSFHDDAPPPKQQEEQEQQQQHQELEPPSPADLLTRLKRKDNFAKPTAPVSWFPEVSPPTGEEDLHFRHEPFPVPISRPVDHDAMSFSSRMSKFSKHSGRQLSEIVPPRTSSIPKGPLPPRSPLTPKSPGSPGWKGLTRSISVIRRQSVNLEPDQQQPQSQLQPQQQPQQEQQQQQQPSLQPPHQPTKTVPKKPKMIPRGANERADPPIIPPFTPHLVMV